jgi:hypothetical protein
MPLPPAAITVDACADFAFHAGQEKKESRLAQDRRIDPALTAPIR